MAIDTLRNQLAACRPSLSFTISPNTRRVILMTRPDEISEALEYIRRQAPNASVMGIMPFPDCLASASDPIVGIKGEMPHRTYTHRGNAMPFLPLAAVRDYPEAAVLVFSSSIHPIYSTPSSNALFFYILRETAHVYYYPAIQDGLWCTQAMPDFFRNNEKELEWVYSKLADEKSKTAFAGAIKAVVTGDIGYMRLAHFRQYQYPPTWPKPGDIFIDGGTCSPSDICRFAAAVGPSGRVYGFEPDPEAYASILAELENRPEKAVIELSPMALFSEKRTMDFTIATRGCSRLGEHGSENQCPCLVTDLDSFVVEHGIARVDVIKLDIEGAEVPCLRGAARILCKDRPRLMISGYHNRKQDLTAVPRTILEIEPNYALYFATSYMMLGEMVFYAR